MNQLHSIVLLNSRYGPVLDISCAASTHILASPGLGQERLMELVTFFFQGEWPDPQQSRNLHDDLFPQENSWLLYRVHGATYEYTLAIYRQGNHLLRQFLPGDWVIEDWQSKGKVLGPAAWEKALKKKKISLPPLVESEEVYQKILFGQLSASEKKSYAKLSFFSTERAEAVRLPIAPNLPAFSIQESLLRLSGQFPKSLALPPLQHLLTGFQSRRQEINRFESLVPKLPALEALHKNWQQFSEQEAICLQLLPAAYEAQQQTLAATQAKLEQITQHLQQLAKDLRHLESDQASQLNSSWEGLGQLRALRKEGEKKASFYQQLNISQLLVPFTQLPLLQAQLAELEKRIHESAPSSAKQKKTEQANWHAWQEQEKLRLRLEQEAQHLRLQREYQEKTSTQLQQLTELAEQENKLNEQSQVRHQAQQEELRTSLSRIQLAVAHLPTEFPAAQQIAWQTQEHQTALQEFQLAADEQRIAEQLLQLEEQKKREQKALETEQGREEARFASELSVLESRIHLLTTQLSQLSGTFLAWLESRYPGWENSIGKIAREEILLHPYLSPQIERLNELFFGLQLDVEEIEVDLPTESNLREQLTKAEQELEEKRQARASYQQNSALRQQRLEKRIRQKKRNFQKELRQLAHEREQCNLRIRKGQVEQQQIIQEQKVWWEKTRFTHRQEQQEIRLAIEKLSQMQLDVRTSQSKQVEEQEKRKQQTLAQLAEEWEQHKRQLAEQETKALAAFSPQSESKQEQENWWQVWQEKQQQVAELTSMAPLIYAFQHDQRVYLDRLPLLPTQIEQLERSISSLKLQHQQEEAQLRSQIQELQTAQQNLLTLQAKAAETEARWQKVQQRSWYRVATPEQTAESPLLSTPELSGVLAQLTQNHAQVIESEHAFRFAIQEFWSHFSPDALWGQVAAWIALPLADQLDAVIEASETTSIKNWQERLAEEFLGLLSGIREQSQEFVGVGDQVAKLLPRLQGRLNDLQASSPQQLSLSLTDEPALVHLLRRLAELENKLGPALGGPSLFQPEQASEDQQTALTLLGELAEQILGRSEESLPAQAAFQLGYALQSPWEEVSMPQPFFPPPALPAIQQKCKDFLRLALLSLFQTPDGTTHSQASLLVPLPELSLFSEAEMQGMLDFGKTHQLKLMGLGYQGSLSHLFPQTLSWELDGQEIRIRYLPDSEA